MLGRRIATQLTVVVTVLTTTAVLTPSAGAIEPRAGGPTAEQSGRTASARFVSTSRACPTFTRDHVLAGRTPRRDPRCRPLALDGTVVRAPVAERALRRDARNYGHRGLHGTRGRHAGTDLVAACGAAVRAAHAGKVFVLEGRSRLGRRLAVSTGPRRLTTWYGNLGRLTVRNGEHVESGQTIARVGRSGAARRCQVHFVVTRRPGAADPGRVNPTAWLRTNAGSHLGGLPPAKAAERTFMVASFNVLGASHTRGSKHWPSYSRRMTYALDLLRSNGVHVVGLQELEPKQRTAFTRQAGRRWAVFSPQGDPRDSIAWRRSRFRFVWSDGIRIPYRENVRTMPVVALRDKATGRKTIFISVHNVSGDGGVWAHRRRVSVDRELAAVARLRKRTGLPVVLMGDFNDRRSAFFCRMSRNGLVSSFGGVRGDDCEAPLGTGIDWILRTKGLRFAGSQRLRDGMVARTSDHPVVLARLRR